MIPQFIASLSDTGKKILMVALIIVVAALFDRLLIAPTLTRMATIDQDIAKEESTIKQDIHFLGYKDKIIKESEAYSKFVTEKVPTEEEIIGAFLKRIEMLAAKANVTLIKVTPSTGTQEKNYLKYQEDIECSGKLADVITFMHLIDTSDDLTKVVKFNFAAKKDADELKATMSIVKAVVGKKPVLVTYQEVPDQASKEANSPAAAQASSTAR